MPLAPVISSDPDESDQLMSSLERESDDLWKHHRLVAIATLTLPVWFSGAVLFSAFLWGGLHLARKLVLATVASAAAGRFIIWGGENADDPIGFTAIQLALLVLALDTMWAIVLTWHAGVLFHVPWIGGRLKAAVMEGCHLLKKNRWMRRVTLGAVLLFVMLPVSSTGSIGGSLLGRLLGLSRTATLLSVLTGSILGGAVMLAGAEALSPLFRTTSPLLRYGGIAVIAIFFTVLAARYRRSIDDEGR